MPDTILSVKPEHLQILDAASAVALIRDLVWAELRRIGLSSVHATVSACIDVPDGGVDASVRAPGNFNLPTDTFLDTADVALQIKSGQNFRPHQPAQLKRELFGDEEPSRDHLKREIRASLDANGRYVVVCTGTDPTPDEKRGAEDELGRLLRDCGYAAPKVGVWGQSHLIGLVQEFPALALRLNGNGRAQFVTHELWASQAEMRRIFTHGPRQDEFVAALQRELRRDVALHVRVTGEAGIGKTRLVLESTRASDLSPLLVYCESAHVLMTSGLLAELLRAGTRITTILVVDECDPAQAASLWNQVSHLGRSLRLVSIYNDFEPRSGTTVLLATPPLDDELAAQIIASYEVPLVEARRWAEYCNGSPRVSHVIGQNLRSNPENVLRTPDTVDLWDRYIAGGDELASDLVRERKIVLQHIALFRRFGYGAPLTDEARGVARLAGAAAPAITWGRFCEVVKTLRDRRLLQGETTLYLTPRLLHIKLWADWWDVHGDTVNLDGLLDGLPTRLVDWFWEMFTYARESRAALAVAERFLGRDGPFRDHESFGLGRSARLFLALTDAAPEAALQCLRRALGRADRTELLRFRHGRREVVWALEKIAVWRSLFPDAARLLLALGEAENEDYSNNATGVFASLFSLGYGGLAPTEAPPQERLPVLREALDSLSEQRRTVALRACERAMEAQYLSRMIGAEYQGLRKPPRLWMPERWEEVADAYRAVWNLVVSASERLAPRERARAGEILLARASGVSQIGDLDAMVVATLKDLIDRAVVARAEVTRVVEGVLYYQRQRLGVERRVRWEELRAVLVGADFHSQVERFVGMELIQDHFDDEGEAADKVTPRMAALAEQAVAQPELIARELPWLVTDAAKNGYQFGHEIGQRDERLLYLGQLLEAQRQHAGGGSAVFLSGYLAAVFGRDTAAWERILDDLAADPQLKTLVPELTWRTGVTERAARRVLALVESGVVAPAVLGVFRFGAVVRQVPEALFTEWIECLLRADTRASVRAALGLYSFYYRRRGDKQPSRTLTLRLLIAAPFFAAAEPAPSQMEEYEWTELAKAHLTRFPEDGPELARAMVRVWGAEGTIVEGFHSEMEEILTTIAAQSPAEVWNVVSGVLGPPFDSRSFHIRQWLREGGLQSMRPDDVWAWVESDVEGRAWYTATFVPPVMSKSERTAWARELLVRYGGREDVRESLRANFQTGSWSGPRSSHLEASKEDLQRIRSGETDANVRFWLDEFIAELDGEIRAARIAEERGGF